jgi:hypothetical protein
MVLNLRNDSLALVIGSFQPQGRFQHSIHESFSVFYITVEVFWRLSSPSNTRHLPLFDLKASDFTSNGNLLICRNPSSGACISPTKTVYTSVVSADEWSRFAVNRKGLRTTDPVDLQRSICYIGCITASDNKCSPALADVTAALRGAYRNPQY